MKKQQNFQRQLPLAACLLLLSTVCLHGQVVVGGNYSFVSSLPSNHFLAQVLPLTTTRVGTSQIDKPIMKNYILTVVDYDSTNDLVYYKYWKFEKGSFGETTYGSDIHFLPMETFKLLTKPVYPRFKGVAAGAYTVPIRFRGTVAKGDFDFEQALSLQTNAVFKWGSRKTATSWFDLSLGIGLSGVTLNELNSSLTDETQSATAFTWSVGTVFNLSPSVNLGLFFGKDYLGEKDKDVKWEYDKKLWLGVGINVLFTVATAPDNTGDPGEQSGGN